jgi:DNA-binding NarL/FixJ family response regulator
MRVVVVTTFDLDEYAYGALRGGACGFLLKDSGPTLPAEAVRAAAVGDSLVSPSVTARLLKHVKAEADPAAGPEAPRPQEPLTDRELDVVRLVALGHTNAEIAASMFVSLHGEDAPRQRAAGARRPEPRGDRRPGMADGARGRPLTTFRL